MLSYGGKSTTSAPTPGLQQYTRQNPVTQSWKALQPRSCPAALILLLLEHGAASAGRPTSVAPLPVPTLQRPIIPRPGRGKRLHLAASQTKDACM